LPKFEWQFALAKQFEWNFDLKWLRNEPGKSELLLELALKHSRANCNKSCTMSTLPKSEPLEHYKKKDNVSGL